MTVKEVSTEFPLAYSVPKRSESQLKSYLTEFYWKKELTMAKIAILLEVDPSTIYDRMRKLNIPTRSISEALHLSYKNGERTDGWNHQEIEYLRRKYPSTPARIISKRLKRTKLAVWSKAFSMGLRKRFDPPPMTGNLVFLGKICIFLLTDGHLLDRGRKGGVVGFDNCAQILHKQFRTSMHKVFGDYAIPHQKIVRSKVSKRDVFSTRYYSKFIARFLLKLSPTYRTLQFNDGSFPPAKIPDFVFNLTQRGVTKILRVAYDCEGSINKRKNTSNLWRISLSCKHPFLRSQYLTLLSKKRIRASERHSRIDIESKEGIRKFASLIGFSHGVTISKGRFKGMHKSVVLKHALYELSQSRCKAWKEWEIHFVLNNYCDIPTSKIAQKLRRSESSIRGKILRLGVNNGQYN